jgi:hypothetical protein
MQKDPIWADNQMAKHLHRRKKPKIDLWEITGCAPNSGNWKAWWEFGGYSTCKNMQALPMTYEESPGAYHLPDKMTTGCVLPSVQ